MNYDKLSRALRYYYDKNIMTKVTSLPPLATLTTHSDIEYYNNEFNLLLKLCLISQLSSVKIVQSM